MPNVNLSYFWAEAESAASLQGSAEAETQEHIVNNEQITLVPKSLFTSTSNV